MSAWGPAGPLDPPDPPTPRRWIRLRSLAGYPLRLGPYEMGAPPTAFGRLAAIHCLSSAGDALVAVALAGSVFVSVPLHAARGRTALGLAFTMLPFAAVAPLVGPLVQRVPGGRQFVLLLAAVGRLVAAVLMAFWIHSLLLFPAAFVSLVCSKIHAVTRSALVPEFVGSDRELVRANSRLAVGSAVASAIAAGVGGLVYKLFGSPSTLDLDAVVFAVTAWLVADLLRPDEPSPGGEAAGAGRTRADPRVGGADAPAGPPSESADRPVPDTGGSVRAAFATMAAIRAMAGFLTALVVFAFRAQGAPLIWYGLAGLASVLGNLTGALAAPPAQALVASEARLEALSSLVIGGCAVGAAELPAAHYRVGAVMVAFVAGVAGGVAKMCFDAMVQAEVTDADRARMFARFETAFQATWVAAALLPVLIDIGLRAGFVVMATVLLLLGLRLALSTRDGGRGRSRRGRRSRRGGRLDR